MPSQTDDLVHDDDIAVAADFLDYLRENSLAPPSVRASAWRMRASPKWRAAWDWCCKRILLAISL
jgi:hypothetical protein